MVNKSHKSNPTIEKLSEASGVDSTTINRLAKEIIELLIGEQNGI